jgi:hypothetical protein
MAKFLEGPDTKQKMGSNFLSSRRKILGWLGFGVVAALFAKALPIRRLHKNFGRGKREEIIISMNESAVMRKRSEIPSSGKESRNV